MTKPQLLLISLLAFFVFTFVFLPWFGSLVARMVNAIAESRISLYIDYLTLGLVGITLTLFFIVLYVQLVDLDHNSEKIKDYLRMFSQASEQDIENVLVFLKVVNLLPLETRKVILFVLLTIIWMAIIGPAAFAVGSIRSAVEHKKFLAEHQKSLHALESQLSQLESQLSQIERKISVHVDERSFDKLTSQLREVEEKVAELSRT